MASMRCRSFVNDILTTSKMIKQSTNIKSQVKNSNKRHRISSPSIANIDITDYDTLNNDDRRITQCLEAIDACFGCAQTIDADESSVQCSDACRRTFHTACCETDKDTTIQQHHSKRAGRRSIVCVDCKSGNWPNCAICAANDGTKVQKCVEKKCNRYYHRACIVNYEHGGYSLIERQNDQFICPAHSCQTCFSYGRDNHASEGKFYQIPVVYCPGVMLACMRCPVVYHCRDECLPAGCYLINDKYLLCPLHLDEKEAYKHGKKKDATGWHVNYDYCADCQKSGLLTCCDRCPAVFHRECLSKTDENHLAPTNMDDKQFLCTNCCLGRFPMHNDLIWAKFSHYRWWPSIIAHPLHIPERIDNLPHAVGEFAIRFLGTNEWTYVSHGRAFALCENDLLKSCSISSLKSTDKAFRAALDETRSILSKRKLEKAEWPLTVPNMVPKYRHLKKNVLGPDAQQNNRIVHDDEYPICSCNPNSDHPCANEFECTNRATNTECNDQCPAGEKCENRRFSRREYVDAVPFFAGERGWGLRCLNDVEKGTFIMEYVGEVIGKDEFLRRYQQKSVDGGNSHYYFLQLDKTRYIDAELCANMSRFMNHSCDPTCRIFRWMVGDDSRIGLFATRDLIAGEELTFNYSWADSLTGVKFTCKCASPSCTGFIGEKRKIETTTVAISGKAKRSLTKRIKRDKHCRICDRQNGALIACGRYRCTRVYHLACLDAAKQPNGGKWSCPCHFCHECDRRAIKQCSKCEYAWCERHLGSDRFVDKTKTICNRHCATANALC